MLKMINPKACSGGWLLGRDDSTAKIAYIAYLKVTSTGIKDGRERFTVAEGPLKGKQGSVLPTIDRTSALVDVSYDTEGLIFVDFDRAKVEDGKMQGVLWMGSRPTPPKLPANYGDGARYATELSGYALKAASSIPLVTLAMNPLPEGWNPLEIPDAPHHGGHYYSDKSKFATVWFRVGHDGDRYLHPGRYSAGCGTVQPDQWTPIYEYLIGRRKDVFSVGAIHVAYHG